jgi:hypothetical protein
MICSFTVSCLNMLSVSKNELETVLKKALMACLRYYAGFRLEKLGNNTREIKECFI